MQSRVLVWMGVFGGLVGALPTSGCTVGAVGDGESDPGQVEQPLHAYSGISFWTGSNRTIPVCFMRAGTQPPSPTSSTWLSEKATLIDAVEQTWGRVANLIRFTWKTGTCPETGSQNYVRVSILGKTAGGNTDNFGWDGGSTRFPGTDSLRPPVVFNWSNPTQGDSVNIVLRADGVAQTPTARLRYLAAHEFGHVLGLPHEQDSIFNQGDCNKGVVTDPNLVQLTPYDPDSIMNYCGPLGPDLTPRDVLGIRKLYGYKNAGEFNGDSHRDVLWRNRNNGQVGYWTLSGTSFRSFGPVFATVPTDWRIVGTGDFNHDGETDLVWQNTPAGQAGLWLMDRGVPIAFPPLFATGVGSDWQIRTVADLDGDGHPDIIWQNGPARQASVWLMEDGVFKSAPFPFAVDLDAAWKIVGAGDFNRDRKDDLVLQNRTTGRAKVWFMNGSSIAGQPSAFATNIPSEWEIRSVGDYNADLMPDVVWSNLNTGESKVWTLASASQATGFPAAFATGVPLEWEVVGP